MPSTLISPSFRPKRCSSSTSNTSGSPATSFSASAVRSVQTIDERLPGQRQDREGPGRQEMLLGAAVVRPFMRDRADDAGLAVVPVHRLDAGHVAQPRLHAVGGDKQRVS